ncbi:MAG: AAC(3) family N-acetyltransferase [Ignavibacteriales bacterium]|nr:AAC(3) family N-acetyltransferase [Ignavibacteriales bacterium]
MVFEELLKTSGLTTGDHLIIHSSYRFIRRIFEGMAPDLFIELIQKIVTEEGSIIIPVFTYNFESFFGEQPQFDKSASASATGALGNVMLCMPDVKRTASPTHSFAVWGKAAAEIDDEYVPISPLGLDSPLSWFSMQPNAKVLMLGCDFNSLSILHFLENITPAPYKDFFCWNFMGKIPSATYKEQKYKFSEVPGCSKSFVNFETHCLSEKIISPLRIKDESYYLIDAKTLIYEGKKFIQSNFIRLLCPPGECEACDSRHLFLEQKNISSA